MSFMLCVHVTKILGQFNVTVLSVNFKDTRDGQLEETECLKTGAFIKGLIINHSFIKTDSKEGFQGWVQDSHYSRLTFLPLLAGIHV